MKIIKTIVLLVSIIYLFHLASASEQSDLNKLSVNNRNVNKDVIQANDKNLINPKDKKHHDDDDDDDDDDDKHHKSNSDDSRKKKMHHSDADSSEERDDKRKHESVNKFSFIHAFFASISVIVVSEIGDKTFFIAAIMAMKHPRAIVYVGAMFALGLMTLLSALLGGIVTKIIPRTYTYYLSSFLFLLFGVKMLREGLNMSKDENTDEEFEEAQQDLRKSEEEENSNSSKNLEAGLSGGESGGSVPAAQVLNDENKCKWVGITRKFVVSLRKYVSPIFLQAFILTFLAEWGDRSQISTIILGARENIPGTIIGGTIGHGLCTGMAVLGGRFVAQRISVRNVTLCGAFVFLFFALSAFFIDPDMD